MTVRIVKNDPPRTPVKVQIFVLSFLQRLKSKEKKNINAITIRSEI